MENNLPYISFEEFNKKVDSWAENNFIFKNMKKHDVNWTWEQLPDRLKNELFQKIGAKPIIYKY